MKFDSKILKRAFVSLGILIVFSILVCTFDVAKVGLQGTSVGFSHLNMEFASEVRYNATFDKITNVFMLIAIMVVAIFGLTGLVQLIKRKSILKVDKAILSLGVVYVVVAVIYILFDKIPVNFRPVMKPGETVLETSFPSSHVLVIVTVLATAVVAVRKLLPDKKAIANALLILAPVICVATVILRALSGVHWITDIVAGVLFAVTISEFYVAYNNDEH